jgi:hypothetical protein
MISGNSVRVQFGKETTYGTAITPTVQVRIASEDFKYVNGKKQEGVLTGNIGNSRYDTMGIRTENSMSILARPDDIGHFLKGVFGAETVTGSSPYTHTFTPIGNAETDYVPSYTFSIDKRAAIYKYTGCEIESIKISAKPEDYVILDIEMYGYDEVVSGTMPTLIPSQLHAFKFCGGSLVTLAGNVYADITSIDFSYKNNMENSLQTTGTLKHYVRPQPNNRDITLDLEVLYTTQSETFRNTWFKTDDILAAKFEFVSDEIAAGSTKHSLEFTIPSCQLTGCSNAVSGAQGIRQTMNLVGIDIGSGSLITAVLKNATAGQY